MTDFLWTVVVSAAAAVFATLFMLIFVGWLTRTRSPGSRTIGTAAHLSVLAGGVCGLWLGVIVDRPLLRIMVAIGGSALLTVDALIATGIAVRWLEHRKLGKAGA